MGLAIPVKNSKQIVIIQNRMTTSNIGYGLFYSSMIINLVHKASSIEKVWKSLPSQPLNPYLIPLGWIEIAYESFNVSAYPYGDHAFALCI